MFANDCKCIKNWMFFVLLCAKISRNPMDFHRSNYRAIWPPRVEGTNFWRPGIGAKTSKTWREKSSGPFRYLEMGDVSSLQGITYRTSSIDFLNTSAKPGKWSCQCVQRLIPPYIHISYIWHIIHIYIYMLCVGLKYGYYYNLKSKSLISQ